MLKSSDAETLKSLKHRERAPVDTDKWNFMLENLKAYRDEFGDCIVPSHFLSDPNLSEWVQTQQHEYFLLKAHNQEPMTYYFLHLKEHNQQQMTEYQKNELETLGFTFVPGGRHPIVWNERFAQLEKYKEKHGHCNVPHIHEECPKLRFWVRYHRRTIKILRLSEERIHALELRLSEERINALDRIGSIWTPLSIEDKAISEEALKSSDAEPLPSLEHHARAPAGTDKWNVMLEKLKAHRDEFGDCIVLHIFF